MMAVAGAAVAVVVVVGFAGGVSCGR